MSAAAVGYNPLRDKSYEKTALGRDVTDFLAWLELGDASPRTLDQYERDLARGCLMFPGTPIQDWTDAELLHGAQMLRGDLPGGTPASPRFLRDEEFAPEALIAEPARRLSGHENVRTDPDSVAHKLKITAIHHH